MKEEKKKKKTLHNYQVSQECNENVQRLKPTKTKLKRTEAQTASADAVARTQLAQSGDLKNLTSPVSEENSTLGRINVENNRFLFPENLTEAPSESSSSPQNSTSETPRYTC